MLDKFGNYTTFSGEGLLFSSTAFLMIRRALDLSFYIGGRDTS